MEYVRGVATLESHCHRKSLLSFEAVADIVFKCAEALDYAHRKGVIHRDIKPGNILLGENGAVKLADFSIALLADPHLFDTQLMVPAGSPLYMSPEQIREDEVTGQSDLFSLGVVLYELLSGRHPFMADTLAGVTHRVVHEPHPPISRHAPQVPVSLQRLVDKALAKERGQRYASALDFAADLSQIFSELRHPQDGIATEGRADALMRLSFFRAFPDAEVWELLRWASWEEHGPGTTILSEGEDGDSFFIVVDGRVSVRKGEHPIATLESGQCFGEIGYLSRQRRTATVVTDTTVSLLRMNAELIDQASQSCQVQFQKVFIAVLIDRLVDTTRALAAAES